MKQKSNFKKITEAVVKSVYYIIPFAITGGVLISLAYIIDFAISKNAVYGLGSENPVAVILKSLGSLTFSLMLPVMSSAIATELGGKKAFFAGLTGGFLAQNGATIFLVFGDTTAVSGFIGAIISGIFAGYITLFFSKMFGKIKGEFKNTAKNTILPVVSIALTGLVILILNPLTMLLNTLLSAMLMIVSKTNSVAFGAILGLMTAADMGGAFSKAAFIFAAASIASGEYTAMASVMAAGMTINLSIFLSSLMFKVKFSGKENGLAKANLLFGICGVSEGAIPVAAKSPVRVIPACAAGSAVSGAMSAGFGCTLIAPYGGLLVIPLVGRPLLFIVSVFTGTLVGALLLGLLKKEAKTEFTVPQKVEIEIEK